MYYTQEQIDRANQADLVSFLQGRGEQLTRAGQEYRWKRHDSLTIRGNKWYRHSQSKGGAPIDFVMEFFGKSFTEAVELLTGEKGAAPPPDRPSPASFSDFRLPPRSSDNRIARNYLTAARHIDEDVSGFFFSTGDIYEEAAHHNAIFVGRDEDGVPRYAHQRGTAGNFRLDVKGSDKAFNFCYRGEGERLFVFEAPIDLLSFLCLFKKDWQKQSYLALGGVGDKALMLVVYGRMIEIYLVTSVAPIPMATMVNHEWGSMGQNYLKSLLALGFQAFLILVCVGIYAVLIQTIAATDDISGAIWACMGYTVLLCFTLFKTGSLAKSVFSAH